MNPKDTTAVLRDLDACRSIFDVLSHMLENNAGIRDLHSLAVLAEDGKLKCDAIADVMAG